VRRLNFIIIVFAALAFGVGLRTVADIVFAQEPGPPAQAEDPQPPEFSAAQPSGTNPTVRGPVALWTFPSGSRIHALTVSPDGKSAYVAMTLQAVNLWAVLVHYWPEEAALTVTLLLLILLRRTRCQCQVIGEPYCRTCGYRLTKLESATCPECGALLTVRNRVLGKRPPWRAVVLVAVLATVLVMYVLYADRAQRGFAIRNAVNWSSPSLYEWSVANRQQWLCRGGGTGLSRIVEIDVTNGSIGRVILERMEFSAGYSQLLLSAPVQCLVGLSPEGRIDLIDVRSGATRHPANNRDVRGIRKMSLDETGRVLYATGRDQWRIDIQTGACERLLPPAGMRTWGGFVIRGMNSSSMWLVHGTRGTDQAGTTMHATQWNVQEKTLQRSAPLTLGNAILAAGRDGSKLVDIDLRGLIRIQDMDSGTVREIEASQGGQWNEMILSNDGRLLIANESGSMRTAVFDLDRGTHIAIFQSTARMQGSLAIKPDATRVLSCINDLTDFRDKIAVFDLGGLAITEAADGN
jgi:hypothetical protein